MTVSGVELSHAEQVLLNHLTTVKSVEVLALEGFLNESVLEIIPTELVRDITGWTLRYFFQNGRQVAPSKEAIAETWQDELEKREIVVDDDVETDSIEWAIEQLRARYATWSSQEFVKKFATTVFTAGPDEKVEKIQAGAHDLYLVAQSLTSRHREQDAAEGFRDALERYEQRKGDGRTTYGMTFGLPLIDEHIHGVHPGELVTFAAGSGVGKALPNTAWVLTPQAWRRMGDLEVGDRVIGRDGSPTRIKGVYPQGRRQINRVHFSDGSVIETCEEHLWTVRDRKGRPWRVMTTAEIEEWLKRPGRNRLAVPTMSPPEFEDAGRLPYDPYALGLLLGDGCFRGKSVTFCAQADKVLVEAFGDNASEWSDGRTYHIRGGKDMAIELSLWQVTSHDKFVPGKFMYGKAADRHAILQGILDTDGSPNVNGGVEYSTVSYRLAQNVQWLAESLGGYAKIKSRTTRNQSGKSFPSFRLNIKLPDDYPPFRLQRKLDKWVPPTKYLPQRSIVKVERELRQVEMTCIAVEAEDSLYVTEHGIVTHNSWVAGKTALNEWSAGRLAALFTLENDLSMTFDRLACMKARVNYERWQRGDADDGEVERVRMWADKLAKSDNAPIVLMPDRGSRTVPAIVRKAVVLGAQSLIVDQLSFVEHSPTSRERQRWAMWGETIHELKNEISEGRDKLPCLLLHQINREGMRAAAKSGRHEMDHLAEAAEIERTSDFVFALYQSPDAKVVGEAIWQTLKSRRVPPKDWDLAFRLEVGDIRVRAERPREAA